MKQKGFTIIEILIVILILGTLTAIAIPMYQGMTVKAKLTKIINDIGQIQKTIDMYLMEYEWGFVVGGDPRLNDSPLSTLAVYLNNADMPSNTDFIEYTATGALFFVRIDIYTKDGGPRKLLCEWAYYNPVYASGMGAPPQQWNIQGDNKWGNIFYEMLNKLFPSDWIQYWD